MAQYSFGNSLRQNGSSPSAHVAASSSSSFSSNQQQQPQTALQLLKKIRQDRNEKKFLCLLGDEEYPIDIGITELAGSAGSGKTQVALNLCVQCALANSKALYVSLGTNAITKSSRRLRQMLVARYRQIHHKNDNHQTTSTTTTTTTAGGGGGTAANTVNGAETLADGKLSNIWTFWVQNTDDLFEFIQQKVPLLLSREPDVSIIILDSIADLFRVHEESWHDRSSMLFQIAAECKYLSTKYSIPILMINQVTSNVIDNGFGQNVHPALGLSWSQCVNASFMVSRQNTQISKPPPLTQQQEQQDNKQSNNGISDDQPFTTLRQLTVSKSPNISCAKTSRFIITDLGVVRVILES